jgi:hypothetical protein
MAIAKRTIEVSDSKRAAKKALAQRSGSFKISKGQAKAASGMKRAARSR